jgi:hypothetical protein
MTMFIFNIFAKLVAAFFAGRIVIGSTAAAASDKQGRRDSVDMEFPMSPLMSNSSPVGDSAINSAKKSEQFATSPFRENQRTPKNRNVTANNSNNRQQVSSAASSLRQRSVDVPPSPPRADDDESQYDYDDESDNGRSLSSPRNNSDVIVPTLPPPPNQVSL